MTELTTILQLLILALWCHGWHHLLSPGEALYFLSRWAYRDLEDAKRLKERKLKDIARWYSEQQVKTPDEQLDSLVDLYNEKQEQATEELEHSIYLQKPLVLCPICFASIYGTCGYLLLNYTTWGIIPVTIIALVSVNKMMMKLL